MALLLNPWRNPDDWLAEFGRLLPDDEFRLWPDIGDPTEIEFAITWRLPRADVNRLVNLRAVLSMAAGVENWIRPDMPNVAVVRLADPEMSNEMAAYTLAWVIRFQRGFDRCEQAQVAHRWESPDYDQAWKFPVGILGFGEIGSRVGRAFADLGYPVNAWSRSGGEDPAVTHYAGPDRLDDFLGASAAVVNVLPKTPQTEGLLTAARFAAFRPGSLFINIGRGSVVADEDDLIAALDDGPLGRAVLDVTEPEPPTDQSRLWDHPKVHLTGHIAGSTQVRSAARLIADNITRIRQGQEPFPLLDRARGY